MAIFRFVLVRNGARCGSKLKNRADFSGERHRNELFTTKRSLSTKRSSIRRVSTGRSSVGEEGPGVYLLSLLLRQRDFFCILILPDQNGRALDCVESHASWNVIFFVK